MFQYVLTGSDSGEVDFVILAVFSNSGHLRHSTWPNFTILRLWSQVMLHEKFENHRSSTFIEEVCLNKMFLIVDARWMTHNVHLLHWFTGWERTVHVSRSV